MVNVVFAAWQEVERFLDSQGSYPAFKDQVHPVEKSGFLTLFRRQGAWDRR
jgi:hypothetical protein